MKTKYDNKLLQQFCKENDISLFDDYTSERITRDTIIEGNCSNKECLHYFKKSFRYILSNGALCLNCANGKRLTKFKKTCLDKFGYENPIYNQNVKNKIKEQFMEKYGKESHFHSEVVKEKIKSSNLRRYGFENVAHNPEISEKASKRSYKLKEYILPSGNTIHLQGYEKFGIDDLLKKEQINENDIITSRIEVPEVWYNDSSGKKRRYYVDFYIPTQNRCVEVKSKWTMEKNKDIVFLKQNAVKENGFLCDLWVYDKNGEIIECYK